jgi:type III restriction enzyme
MPMKFKFKVQSYQTHAVMSVVDCFAGQPKVDPLRYRFDVGKAHNPLDLEMEAFRNPAFQIGEQTLLENVQAVQRRQNLPISNALVSNATCKLNLDIEMETGTGKTYCYIKSIFELNKRYGWSKFIIVVPSIAIREGVKQSLDITAEHFLEEYHKKARHFIYNSKDLTPLESFSQDAGINVMVINIQAFNATGADNRRIYEVLDDFQSRRPIDVISRNHPILILDEPQKIKGAKTLEGLKKFNPMMILRYSATHVVNHNKVHRLDALDAYNQKLVKKIAVRGISVKGLQGTNAYLYLERVDVSKKAPIALLELEVKRSNGIGSELLRIGIRDNLYDKSKGLDQYRGYVVSQIDARTDTVEFTNGVVLHAGEAVGDVNELTLRRIQIREAIRAHLLKEKSLFAQGIKTLSLFFIDHVASYRDYGQADEKGDYARIFEAEYAAQVASALEELPLDNHEYRAYLQRIDAGRTHTGYFSIDKKSKRLTDPTVKARGEDAGLSDDVDAYDLILKEKGLLLSFDRPERFIFSHSALREGWDNPNVFVMCMLKHSDNTISRRQEVGRGLRLAVNRHGDRMDDPAQVHEINVLTVIVNESYKEFVTSLQSEISASLSARPRVADKGYFEGKVMQTPQGPVTIDGHMATGILFYLIANQYIDRHGRITERYHNQLKAGALAALPEDLEPHTTQVVTLINGLFSDAQLPAIADDRKPKANPLNSNFEKAEFLALWERIHHRAVYQVAFDSEELIRNSVKALDKSLRVTPLTYLIEAGMQKSQVTDVDLKEAQGFKKETTKVEEHKATIHSAVTYDLVGKIAEVAKLTRATVAAILSQVQPAVFKQFRQNPEQFIAEASKLIQEQKATMIVDHITYNLTGSTFDASIFTTAPDRVELQYAGDPLQKHIRDYVVTDSQIERDFVTQLDTFEDVVVYSKLPRKFEIPTPVGGYNPDWAIAFRAGSVQHVYFVAETKGSLSTLDLRGAEEAKIACARQFFEAINARIGQGAVRYDVVDGFQSLLDLVVGRKVAALPSGQVLPFGPVVVEATPEERYVTCLPLVPLQAAAGAFGEAQHIVDGDYDWVRYTGSRKLQKGMFVAQVVGKSMEPLIPDGAYCIFNAGSIAGTRQGKVVLVMLRDAVDAETGQRFTVKEYASEKSGDGRTIERVILKARNRAYESLVFEGDAEGGIEVLGEFLEVV